MLVDIMMPVMDGYATMRAMRKLPAARDLPIIAVTAKVGRGAPALHRRGRHRLRLQAGRDGPTSCACSPTASRPRRRADGSPAANALMTEHRARARRRRTILVVDDNAAKRLALRAMLAPLGHAVVEADSGRAALRAVLRQNFAVILMDVRMPTMDGYETAKLIRQRSQSERTPIIFITAFGRDETETHTAYASGAVDFIFTPIRVDVLRAKVSAFVDLYLQSQELQRSLESITEPQRGAARERGARAGGAAERGGRDRDGRRGRPDRVVQPLGATAVRLPRGGGDRAAAAADHRADPSRRLPRSRAGSAGAC